MSRRRFTPARLREILRARREIHNWRHFCREQHRILPPEQRELTRIHLRNGLTVDARIGTADLTAVKAVFLNDHFRRMDAAYDVVVDAGAHIGCFSLHVARRSRRVYAIEPAADNLGLLVRNLAHNGITNVTAVGAALAARDGRATLNRSPTHSDSHTTARAGASDAATIVPAVSLASLMRDNAIETIDMMKMDCEGAEYDVLMDLPAGVAQRIGELYLEYHTPPDPAQSYEALHQRLLDLGFTRERLRRGRNHGYAHYRR